MLHLVHITIYLKIVPRRGEGGKKEVKLLHDGPFGCHVGLPPAVVAARDGLGRWPFAAAAVGRLEWGGAERPHQFPITQHL